MPARQELLLTRHAGQRVGVAVDRLVGRVQAVIQSLGEGLHGLSRFSGATILGDGSVSLILDLSALVSESLVADQGGHSTPSDGVRAESIPMRLSLRTKVTLALVAFGLIPAGIVAAFAYASTEDFIAKQNLIIRHGRRGHQRPRRVSDAAESDLDFSSPRSCKEPPAKPTPLVWNPSDEREGPCSRARSPNCSGSSTCRARSSTWSIRRTA